jgi:mono/diheme cytochrome c family protein
MSRLHLLAASLLACASPALADEVSVANGSRIAIISGCHDCHTAGYAESGGELDAAVALTGSPVGFQGPWGTTYPANLRITLSKMGEEDFVGYAHNLQTRPPMPWFNLHAWTDAEARSFYQYVKSLGEPGAPAPAYVAPGSAPKTPYIVFAPPQKPAQ